MTFSLRTLLLMFPALIVSYYCSWVYLRHSKEQWIDLQIETEMLASLQKETAWMKANRESANQSFPIAVLNENLEDVNFYWSQPIDRIKMGMLWPRDSWGQPFKAVALDERGEPAPNVKESMVIGYYSVGQDGKSDSYGNDPDDLNSWRPSTEYYLEQAKRKVSDRARIDALGMACIPLTMIVGIVYYFRDPHLGGIRNRKRHDL